MASTKVKCFLLNESEQTKLFFRRYKQASSCPDRKRGHEARVFWKEVTNYPGEPKEPLEITDEMKKRLKFPTTCSCGYEFDYEDEWQIFRQTLWENKELDLVTTLQDAPAGAMWKAWWYKDDDLFVKLPNGSDWNIDGEATNGKQWTRTGAPPNITVKPSIGIKDQNGGWDYHGKLQNGWLIEC